MPAHITITEKIGIGFGSIGAPEMTTEQAEIEAREISTFRKKIDWRNPAVCIDGRTLAELMKAMELGAHMAGGVETLLVAAKSIGYSKEGAELVAYAKERGFTLGGHDADSNKADNYTNGTGCGACDKCDGNCGLFAQHKAAVEPTMQALLGKDFKSDIYENLELVPVIGNIKELVGEDLIETLHNDGEGVSGHREMMVVFNYEEDTTIDRDAYFAATGKQVFVIDMWYIKKLADAMATGVDAEHQASELYHAMVAFQIATYLGLCNGDHRAAIMQPQAA